ncbi:hypothetical protein BD779DRAFT_348878 [Infundibulicybe gibba]|nr:hypothetical protein BD779DRAFT_348878 [Infundibulicybe gibba]
MMCTDGIACHPNIQLLVPGWAPARLNATNSRVTGVLRRQTNQVVLQSHLCLMKRVTYALRHMKPAVPRVVQRMIMVVIVVLLVSTTTSNPYGSTVLLGSDRPHSLSLASQRQRQRLAGSGTPAVAGGVIFSPHGRLCHCSPPRQGLSCSRSLPHASQHFCPCL